MLSHLVCFGRHTITGLLRLQGRTQQDWTADYRLYAQERFAPDKIFGVIRQDIQELLAPAAPLVAAMDDSLLRKSGSKVYGVRYLRDPMSPPFQVNLVRGLRVLQISAAVPRGTQGAARLIPIDFEQAALPAKPRKNAPESAQEAYRQERAKRNINRVGHQRLALLRQQLDQSGWMQRPLIVSIDGRFTNSTVLRHLPPRTTLIGRVRKDSVFFHPPQEQPGRGRKRKYGVRCPTPAALLNDPSVPWQKVEAYAAGQRYVFDVKTLGPVYTAINKGQQALQLIVVKPVRYHLSKTKTDRRQPAFLICTDPDLSLEKVLRSYLWRWDIEVNFRDEKTLLGVGQAQVRTQASNQNAPGLAVAAYAVLLLAALKTYGTDSQPERLKSPRWDKRKATRRLSTNDLRNQMRIELWASGLRTNSVPLCSKPPLDENGRKCDLPLASALFHSIR